MTPFHQSRALADAAAEKLRVFAQPQRLMILSCILDGERHVGEIEKASGVAQPALSQQLAELRRAELVATRRDAKLVYYSLANEGVALCVRTMEAMFGADERTAAAIGEAVGAKSEKTTIASDSTTPARPIGAAAFARIG